MMNIELTSEQVKFLEYAITSGPYESTEQVVSQVWAIGTKEVTKSITREAELQNLRERHETYRREREENGKTPKISVDFKNIDNQGHIYLNNPCTLGDLYDQGVDLIDGMTLIACDQGAEIEGVVQYSEKDAYHVAVVNWDDVNVERDLCEQHRFFHRSPNHKRS